MSEISFPRMRESPSSTTLGDSCTGINDRNETYEKASFSYLTNY
ncbi:MAG: hypothetical protein NT007_09225 [Candidatus Kapabacteria bacterium]|nr:hypothetical protein [Candidatus Kapabacteria bacterium]